MHMHTCRLTTDLIIYGFTINDDGLVFCHRGMAGLVHCAQSTNCVLSPMKHLVSHGAAGLTVAVGTFITECIGYLPTVLTFFCKNVC